VDGCELEHLSTAYSYKLIGRVVWDKNPPLFTKDYKTVKVVLTIAHLDHDEHNHGVNDDRLKAMCQIHHLRYDAEEKKRRKNLK